MKQTPTTNTRASETDWERVDKLRDEEIDYSDIPPTSPELFAKAAVKEGGVSVREPKQAISLRVDKDVLAWFKAQGEGYQTHINAVLEAYVEAQRAAERE